MIPVLSGDETPLRFPFYSYLSIRASRELQELVANTTSCAALTVLLRILLSPHIIPVTKSTFLVYHLIDSCQGGEDLGLKIVKCVFEFDSPLDRFSPLFPLSPP